MVQRWNLINAGVTADEDVYPQLPESPADSKPADLVGTWSGELKLYPRYLTWPATLRLVVREEAERLSAEFRVSFGGRPKDIVYPQLPVSFEDSYFQFVDPDGPNGGFVRYRIVVESASSAVGIAEFITDRAVYGLGSVQLRR